MMNTVQEKLKNLSADAFIHLGEQQMVYIKPVTRDGITGFAVHAATGAELAVLETHEEAVVAAFENELVPAQIH
jgi:hypothetical protein